MGIGATRALERVSAATGLMQEATPVFEHVENVCNAGVLFLVPALVSQGLLKGAEIYSSLKKGYHGLVSILLLLCFMYLNRIKNPEQLKTCKPGELGKLLGLDRVPEVRCLREKIHQIVGQKKAEEFNQAISQSWIVAEDTSFFYIDGHVRVYHGHAGTLTKKYVSREKLCLAGTTDYWVNNELGLPYLLVTGELNEKLKEVLLLEIIPALLRDTAGRVDDDELHKDPSLERFCLVFDREAYDVGFFKKVWEEYRIAVITYRKNVKEDWDAAQFQETEAEVIGKRVRMKLCMKEVELHSFPVLEIRKLSDHGHRTSIITTLKKCSKEYIAGKMFSRWSQENFFKYMVHNYDFDKLTEYGVEAVDENKKVVNPSYRKNEYCLKKLREKLSRIKAHFFTLVEENLDKSIDAIKEEIESQSKLQENIKALETQIAGCIQERETMHRYITVKQMDGDTRYTKLKTESKLFMNVLRMIVYRAETVVATMLTDLYSRSRDEVRMLIKEIIKSDADLKPDYESNTLHVRLHSLSTPRANRAVQALCSVLNDTETIYPGTTLRLIYDTVAHQEQEAMIGAVNGYN